MGIRGQLIKNYVTSVRKIKGEYAQLDQNTTVDMNIATFKQLVFFFDNRLMKGKTGLTSLMSPFISNTSRNINQIRKIL